MTRTVKPANGRDVALGKSAGSKIDNTERAHPHKAVSHRRAKNGRVAKAQQVADLVRQCRFEIEGAERSVGRELLERIENDISLGNVTTTVKENPRISRRS